MTETSNTICAISTPQGTGGIAVIRLSGNDAISIAQSIWHGTDLTTVKTHTAHLGFVVNPIDNEPLDQCIATVYRAPGTFTGEDVVEFSVHGSPWIQRELISLLIRQGARLAEAGEFTRRAFISGRLDLAEAEAVADMIAASSRAAHHIAMTHMRGEFSTRLHQLHDQLLDLASLLELELDFSEEDVEFADRTRLLNIAGDILREVTSMSNSFSTASAIRNGIPVAIVGATNAGKSTLLNRLLHDERAIVSDIHGTTRDTIEDTIEIDGLMFRFIDTAGLRETNDTIERIGIQRTLQRASQASIIIWLCDATAPLDTIDSTWNQLKDNLTNHTTLLAVINKMDVADEARINLYAQRIHELAPGTQTMYVSAAANTNIDRLTQALTTAINNSIMPDQIMITNLRHYEALETARTSITRAIDGLNTNLAADLVAQDIRETLRNLASITGAITAPDILQSIFSRFCIGK